MKKWVQKLDNMLNNIIKERRSIGTHGGSHVTKPQTNRRYGNPQRRFPGNPSEAHLGMTRTIEKYKFIFPFPLSYPQRDFQY